MYNEGGGGYIDEEDCLGFKIWVAELELIVGGSRGTRKADPAQVFLLLQKLVATLERTDRSEVREYQRRCEDALIDILLKGAPPPVRRLVCEALSKLYSRGDQLPLFSRASSLQLFLGTREAFGKETAAEVRLGALELMTALYYGQGRSLAIGVQETAALAARHCARGGDAATRHAALRLLAAAVEGVGSGHRSAPSVQQEALRAVERLLKERDLAEAVRVGVADVLRAIAAAGGAHLWANGMTGYEMARAACLAGLEDPSAAVRAEYAYALGEIVSASASPTAKESLVAASAKVKAHAAQAKALAAVCEQCLSGPFAEAAATSNRALCTALAQAWMCRLTSARLASGVDEAAFIEAAMQPLDALAAACGVGNLAPERGPLGWEADLGAGIAGGERPHAQACLLYVMRAGVVDQLGEGGQRLLLERLTVLLAAAPPAAAPVAIVSLELAALVAEALGEVGEEAAAALEPAITAKLTGPHAAVRVQAASALAALVAAEPGSAARLLNSSLGNLRTAADSLVEAAAAGGDKSRPGPGTPRGVGAAKIKLEMNALHGWALGCAALVAAATRLALGVPSHYVHVAAQIAAALIEAPRAQFAPAACLEREAGYVLVGGLSRAAPAVLAGAAEAGGALALWTPALGQDATAALDTLLNSNKTYVEHDVAAQLWWRTAALQSLAAFVRGTVTDAHGPERQAQVVQVAVNLLQPLLRLLPSHAALKDPARAKAGPTGPLAGASAMLQLRLLEVYAALPSAADFAADHEALKELCVAAVKAAAAGAEPSLVLPALRSALDRRDDVLGPWNAGGEPLERALTLYVGSAGGPHAAAWEAGLRAGVGYSITPAPALGGGDSTSAGATPCPYPQALSLAPALFAAQSAVLGAVLRSAAPHVQVATMEALLSVARSVPPLKKEKNSNRRAAALLAAAAPALAGLGAASPGLLPRSEELATLTRALAGEVATEATAGAALQRAAADLFGAAARLNSDAAALHLVRALCREAAETASLPRRAALALAVGAASRAVGGLGLAAVVPVAAQTLEAVAAASGSAILPWVLHALLSCANSAGLMFVTQVKPALALAQAVLLSEDIYSTPGLLPAVGRLANSIVAALGPDYVLGSAAYDACRSVVAELRAPDTSGVRRPEDAVAAALESVLYAQMLVLFAPGAMPAAAHVAVLVATLPSRQPRLRKAAADTLRHLAERDAPAVLAEHVEPALLAALDGETDPGTAAQLQATLRTLLEMGGAREPSRWLSMCAEVVTAAAPADPAAGAARAAAAAAASKGAHDDLSFGSDDDEPPGRAPPPDAAPPPSPAPLTPGGRPGSGAGPHTAVTPRLRTRVFAARCLLQLPGLACGADARHADPAAAHAAPGGDWLVLQAQGLVDLAFRMVGGQLEALRPLGVELLLCTLGHLGDAEDPLAPGSKLMAQYQAQYVSALRASLAPGASPALQAAGAALAAAFLEKGLAGGDAAVLDRLLGLLCAPIAAWAAGAPDPAQAAYAEWVGAGARVALLEAHAHCAVLAAAGGDEATWSVVSRAQGPHLTLLVERWIGLLQDHAVLVTQPAALAARHKLGLYGRAAAERAPTLAALAAGVAPALRRAWPVALEAAACTLTHDRTAAYGPAGKERHQALLDLTLTGISCAGASSAAETSVAGMDGAAGDGRLRAGAASELHAVLASLAYLTAPRFAREGWMEADSVAQSSAALAALMQQVLAPAAANSAADAGRLIPTVAAAAQAAQQLAAAATAGDQPDEAALAHLLAAAESCVALCGSSAPALASALGALASLACGTAGTARVVRIPLLQRSLSVALALLRGRRASVEQLGAVSTHVASIAKAAAAQSQADCTEPTATGGDGEAADNADTEQLPSVAEVLAAAAVTAAQQAEHAVAAGHAAQAGAAVACALTLGAVAGLGSGDGEGCAAAAPQQEEEEEDEWGGEWADAATSAAAQAPAVPAEVRCSPSQQLCLSALTAAMASAAPPVRLHATRALAGYLTADPPQAWGACCVAAALPPAAAAVHAAVLRRSPLDEAEVQAAGAALQACQAACQLGGSVGSAALKLGVPLLVEAAAPPGQPTPELAQLAVSLLMALAAGGGAAGFRETVAALPPATKQRLQTALAAAAAGHSGVGQGGAGGMPRLQPPSQPSIQLKAFGGLKK